MTDRSYHNPEAIRAFITLALQEDVGDGDVTTLSSFNNDAVGCDKALGTNNVSKL